MMSPELVAHLDMLAGASARVAAQSFDELTSVDVSEVMDRLERIYGTRPAVSHHLTQQLPPRPNADSTTPSTSGRAPP
ncbi:hypothetical protein [Mycobacterium hubeiense]|uniref:hypothetical protein n=1 Tax=Mycobacterium hubeiense TaxID=1867256 RepID=UPI000C7F1745|nr:hypothetical protein [Mycobacterium sp. QGD 101]